MKIIRKKSGTITNSRLSLMSQKEEYNQSFDAEFSFGGSSAEHVSIKPVKDGTSLSLQILGKSLLAWIWP